MLLYSNNTKWNNLIVFIFIYSCFGVLPAQNYIDSLSNIDNSVPVIFSQKWNITRKAPYLIYNGNHTEMQILWQLSSVSECTIDWGLDSTYSTGSAQTIEYGNDHQHSYVIANLQAATKYYYRVTSGTDIHYGSFHTAPAATAQNLKFFAYGDTRSYPADHHIVAGKIINELNTDEEFQTFIISTGDLVHEGDYEDNWDNQFFNPAYPNIISMLSQLPYQACMGNHEGNGLLLQKYFPYPFVSGRYWSFDYGPAHFVVVDQYTSYIPRSAQLTWIENDLATTNKPWKFICLHEPGWTAGHNSSNSSVQNYIQPLCEQYNVPVVIGGHNHYYARAVVNDIHHITTGGGGAPLYTPDPSYPYVVTASQGHHFCKIEIEGGILNFYAVDVNGNEIDNFAINIHGITPYNVSVSSAFVRMGIDSFLVLSELKNPQNHAVNMHALLIAKAHTYTDSAQLFDDGNHGDGLASDGIWGNFIGPLPIEDEFEIDISVTDLDSNMYFVASKLARLTTIGPVKYDNSFIAQQIGTRYRVRLLLRNESTTATVSNINAELATSDNNITIEDNYRYFGDIGPGQTAQSYSFYNFIAQDPPNSIGMQIQIFSNDELYWNDSFNFIFVETGLSESGIDIPSEFALSQNYPNPFNPTITIKYSLKAKSNVNVTLYDISGRTIKTLINQSQNAGVHSIIFDASSLTSGVYFYKLKIGSFEQSRKMILLR